jgi:hypothetical protein
MILYGQEIIPSDIGELIYDAYIKDEQGFDTNEEYLKYQPIFLSAYFKLYSKHIELFGGEPEQWRVTETSPDSITLGGHGSSPYYIKRV